jgi:hypothetical protein
LSGRDGREDAFREFRDSPDTLRVYKGDRLLFASTRERLFPLVEYIDTCAPHESDVTVFDRVTGKAAALLLTRMSCGEIHSELGSDLGAEVLDRFGIRHRFAETVPYIENNRRDGMCPMEELALDRDADEFYAALKERMSGRLGGDNGRPNG